MAAHYGVAVIPARPYAPKDKAKVENGVGLAERWILASLRHRRFFSLAELNEAIGELLDRLNERAFRKLPGCRRSRFEALDEPALRPLPAVKYTYAEWQKVRVGLDYHVDVHGHYYSVPHQLVRRTVEVRITTTTVECFFRGRRVCSHIRDDRPGEQTTAIAHMPKAHRVYAVWTSQRLLEWAGQLGASTTRLIETVLSGRSHRQQGLRSSLGILRLSKAYGADRLEAACKRALALGTNSYTSIESILKHGLDRQPLSQNKAPKQPPLEHTNLRGGPYYQQPSHTEETRSC